MNEVTQQEHKEEIDWFAILQVMADNLRLLVLAPLTAGMLALAYTYTQPHIYTAMTTFFPPQQQQSAATMMLQSMGALAGISGGSIGGATNPGEKYVTFLRSARIGDFVIERLKLQERYEVENIEDARKKLADSLTIMNRKDGLIAVTVDETDPQFAATLANTMVAALGTVLNNFAFTEAQQRRVFFERQLEETKENLAKAERALKASGVSGSTYKIAPFSAVEQGAKLNAAVAAQEIKLASMRGYLMESAPEFKQAMLELSALRSQLSGLGNEERASKGGDSDYISKYRSYKYYETMFELFAKQYEIARLDESREGANIQVLDVAKPPARRSSAKRLQISSVTAVVVGILLLIFVFMREKLNGVASTTQTAGRWQKLCQAIRKAFLAH